MRLVRGKKDGERCKARGLEKRAMQGVDGAVEKDGSKWAPSRGLREVRSGEESSCS